MTVHFTPQLNCQCQALCSVKNFQADLYLQLAFLMSKGFCCWVAPARGCSLLGQLCPSLPGVLTGCPLAVIPGSERRRTLWSLTNAVLHVGGDLCCLSCTHLPWAQLAPVSSETANSAFAKQMIRCIVCLMQQVYFQTHL